MIEFFLIWVAIVADAIAMRFHPEFLMLLEEGFKFPRWTFTQWAWLTLRAISLMPVSYLLYIMEWPQDAKFFMALGLLIVWNLVKWGRLK